MAAILKADNALEKLREMYRSQSSLVHPNLKSLSARTAGSESEELSDRVVKYPIFGGVLSYDLGKPVIFAVIQAALFALQVIGVLFEETSGTWEREFNRIKQSHDTFLNQERESLGIRAGDKTPA